VTVGAIPLAPKPRLAWIDLATPLVMLLIYTNAVVVVVRHHGVPFAVGAALPLLLLAPIARDILVRRQPIVATAALPWIVVFVVIQFAGALFSARPDSTVPELLSATMLESVVLYWLVSNAIRSSRLLQQVLRALVGAGAFMGLIVLHQQLTGSFESDYLGFGLVGDVFRSDPSLAGAGAAVQPRLAGPIGEVNRFAQIMAMALPLALFEMWSARSMLGRGLGLVCVLLISTGCALAFSRGALVGLAAMALYLAAVGQVRLRHLFAVGVIALLTALMVPQYGARVQSLAEVGRLALTGDSLGLRNADGATRGRITEMKAAALAFADHPILGVGPGMNAFHYPRYARLAGGKAVAEERRAHSLYPGLAAEHGLLGLVAFSGILWVTLRELRRTRRRWQLPRPELAAAATALTASLVVYLATSLFLHSAYIRYFWLMLGIAGAAAHLAEQRIDIGRVRAVRSRIE
jgi:O-antigen ligase